MKKSILYSLLIIFVSAIIINPNETMQAEKFGLDLCINTVVPSLLPFFILNHILIHTGFINAVCKVFDKTIRKIFNISANAVSSVVLGITSGYPLGAKTAVSLAEANEISEVEYERVIAFCNNAGPLFIIGTVGAGMYASNVCGYILFLSHLISAILVGLLFRFYKKHDSRSNRVSMNVINRKSLVSVFTDAVGQSMITLLQVCGYIIFFSVVIYVCNILGIIPGIADFLSFAFQLDAEQMKGVLSGILEMTSGINLIASLTNTGLPLRLCLSSIILGWGGLCVHAQTAGILGKHNKKTYLAGKTLQAMFSGLVTVFLCKIFPLPQTVPTVVQLPEQSFYFLPQNLKASAILLGVNLLIFSVGYILLLIVEHRDKKRKAAD